MKDKLQMWSLIVGMGMIGPVALGASINKLITGEIRINRRVFVSAIDNPVLFHVFVIALIFGSLVVTRYMLPGAWLLYKRWKEVSSQS
ncbi:hypothetical protein [Agrobacterium sp. NPDC090273]|uniref:hypothetical protein n=1 Tax=Agrobacterium sp. NPDC090273 TaxID=3363919 RepID=UPI00383B24AE